MVIDQPHHGIRAQTRTTLAVEDRASIALGEDSRRRDRVVRLDHHREFRARRRDAFETSRNIVSLAEVHPERSLTARSCYPSIMYLHRTTLSIALVFSLSHCAGLNKAINGDPKDRVVSEHDKFTGKSSLKATVFGGTQPGSDESLSLDAEADQRDVIVTSLRTDFSDRLLSDFQTRPTFDIAVDGKPLEHGEPAAEPKVLDLHWSSLTVRIAIPVEQFKRLSAMTSMDIRVYGRQRALSDYELEVVREFSRKLP